VFLFSAKHSATLKQQWESKVKPRLKEIKTKEQEKKEELKKDHARRAQEYEESKQAFYDKIEKADLIEIASGVTKRVSDDGDPYDEPPKKNDKVVVHYTGTLSSDGSKFDSSRDRGKPFKFTMGIGQVIPCWEKAVASMVEGERALIECDWKEAYGEKGMPPKIPAKSKIKFDIELISHGPPSVHDEM